MRQYPYYYSKGNVSTLTPLRQATPSMFDEVRTFISTQDIPYKVVACGSLIQGKESANDLDLMLYGKLDNPTKIYECLNIITDFGLNSLHVNTDIFFVEDISYLSRTPDNRTSIRYDVYLGYSIELEMIDGKITKFRDYNRLGKVGLLTKAQFTQPSLKSVERGYDANRHFFLN